MTDGCCQKIKGIITYQQSYYLAQESEPASQRGFEKPQLGSCHEKNIQIAATEKKQKLSEGDFGMTADKVLEEGTGFQSTLSCSASGCLVCSKNR